jgi:hypothetical protein
MVCNKQEQPALLAALGSFIHDAISRTAIVANFTTADLVVHDARHWVGKTGAGNSQAVVTRLVLPQRSEICVCKIHLSEDTTKQATCQCFIGAADATASQRTHTQWRKRKRTSPTYGSGRQHLIIILRVFVRHTNTTGIFIPALNNRVETATATVGGREGTALIPERNPAECATFAIVDFTTKKTE